MLLSVLSTRTKRAYVLAAIGIVTVLSIVISFHSTLNVGLSTYTYDSSRKELIKTPDTPSLEGSSSHKGAGGPTVKSYRKTTCRSSTWGPEWTVDSNGGVCRHGEIGKNGCCLLSSSVPEVMKIGLKPLSSDIQRTPLTVDGESEGDAKEEDAKGKHGTLFEKNPEFEATTVDKEHDKTPEENLGDHDKTTEEKSEDQVKEERKETKAPDSEDAAQFGETLVRPTCSVEHECCAQYEFCVSSCLDFTWQRLHSTTVNARSAADTAAGAVLQLIERLVGDHQAEDDNVAKEYSGTTDLFDWCLLRCRTSGRSVVHQNSFRSSLKHCYGLKDPPLLARMIEKGETE